MEVETIESVEREGSPESAFNHLWLQGDILYVSDSHDHVIFSNHTGESSSVSLTECWVGESGMVRVTLLIHLERQRGLSAACITVVNCRRFMYLHCNL